MNAVVAERDDAAGDDEPWKLPEGWALAKLNEVVERLTDGTHLPPKFTDSGVPFVVIGNIKNNAIDWNSINKWVSPATYEIESKRLRPRRSDILYTAVGSYGHAVRVSDDRDFMFQRHIAYLRPNNAAVDPAFLCYALNSPTLKRQADRAARGVAQKTVTLGSLRHFVLPLAPLPEQRRIVARIDELFAEISEGEAALERARSGLGNWRRALLKAAVTGELTSDWREANKPKETGAGLLDRVRSAEESRKKARRRKTGKEIEDVASDQFPTIPETWAWCHLREIGDIVGGVTVDKKRLPDDPVDVPYLRVANVQRGFLDLKEMKTIRVERDVAQRLLLQPNDILFNEGGDRDKIGRGWIWQQQVPQCIHQNHVFRVRLHDPGLNSFFVSHYANEMGRRFFIEKGKQTTNLASISMSKIGELPVPVPPAEETEVIVDRINRHLATGEDDRGDVDEASTLASALRKSILKSAFEGRLVPQDHPSDVPASEFLARLRTEAPAPGRGRKIAS